MPRLISGQPGYAELDSVDRSSVGMSPGLPTTGPIGAELDDAARRATEGSLLGADGDYAATQPPPQRLFADECGAQLDLIAARAGWAKGWYAQVEDKVPNWVRRATVPSADEQAQTATALDAWVVAVGARAVLMRDRAGGHNDPKLSSGEAKELVKRANGGEVPHTLMQLSEAIARVTAAIHAGINPKNNSVQDSAGDAPDGAVEAERGWFKRANDDDDDDEQASDTATASADEAEMTAALEACPRLHLLSRPKLIALLQMTKPAEINGVNNAAGMWEDLSTFHEIEVMEADEQAYIYGNPNGKASKDEEVVCIRQRGMDCSASLKLLRPYPTAGFGFTSAAASGQSPQATWLQGLFALIRETLEDRLKTAQEKWKPGENRLCELVGNAEGESDAEEFCPQVLILAMRLHFSNVLESGEWEESLRIAEDEYTSAVEMVNEAKRQNAPQLRQGHMEHMAFFLQGMCRDLQDRSAAGIVRFREVRAEAASAAQDEIEVAMLCGDVWRGTYFKWEPYIFHGALIRTLEIVEAERAGFSLMPAIDAEDGHSAPTPSVQLADGPPGCGKTEILLGAARWLVGLLSVVIKGESEGASELLDAIVPALSSFSFMLIIDEANNGFSERSLRAAMAQPQRPGGSIGLTFNPKRKGALLSPVDMETLLATGVEVSELDSAAAATPKFRWARVNLTIPTGYVFAAELLRLRSGLANGDAAVLGAFIRSITRHSDPFGRMIHIAIILSHVVPSLEKIVAGRQADSAMTVAFRWLGSDCTLSQTDEQNDVLRFPLTQRMSIVMPDATAQAAYHRRLVAAVYHPGSTEASIKTLLQEQRDADRRWHAADVVALLCVYPAHALKLVDAVGLKKAGHLVGVGWNGQMRVPLEFTAVHLSPSGEGMNGPAQLWAGKRSSRLLGVKEAWKNDEPARTLTPQVLNIEGAVTVFEFLPAIIFSPVADELLTHPAIDAVMQAKWELLKPVWLFEAGLFTVTFALYLMHALVDDADLRAQLLRGAAACTVPLWYIEYCQAVAGSAMSGVGQGKLAMRIKYVSFENALDISGIFLIGVTLAVGHNATLVAFTVLCCCWRWILYLKIWPTFCELLSSVLHCVCLGVLY